MSDTIMPEERAELRAHFERQYTDPCREAEYGRTTSLRLLNALEAAEKALLKEEVYSEELESQLQDAESEYNASWAVQAITDVAHLVDVLEQCQGTGDDIGAATLEAVQDLKAENARLRCDYGRWAGMISRLPRRIACDVCPHRTDRHSMNCLECCPWEVARRAVAGEGE